MKDENVPLVLEGFETLKFNFGLPQILSLSYTQHRPDFNTMEKPIRDVLPITCYPHSPFSISPVSPEFLPLLIYQVRL